MVAVFRSVYTYRRQHIAQKHAVEILRAFGPCGVGLQLVLRQIREVISAQYTCRSIWSYDGQRDRH